MAKWTFWILVMLLIVVSCSDPAEDSSGGDGDADTDVDTDSDADSDADSDSDADADTDADSDGDTDSHPDTDSDTGTDSEIGTDSDLNPFVTVSNGDFMRGGERYNILSTSIYPWHSKDNAWIEDMVQTAFESGINNIRAVQQFFGITAAVTGNPDALLVEKRQFDEEIWLKHDFLISECAKRGMTVDMELTQMYSGTGGILQLAGFDPNEFQTDTDVQNILEEFYETILNRVNTITGVAYKDDPTISMWSVIGEHLPYTCPEINCATTNEITAFVLWIARVIKDIDSNHLVGADGFIHMSDQSGGWPRDENGQISTYYYDIWSSDLIDYGGSHYYAGKDGFDIADWPIEEWNNLGNYADFLDGIGKPYIIETGIPYAALTPETAVFMFDAIFDIVEDRQLDGIFLWNWNDASGDFDLYPGLTTVQDDLIDVMVAHGAYFTEAESL